MANTPDSWDQNNGATTSFSNLSINAKPFVPNVNAAVFVPTFAQKSPPQDKPVDPTPTQNGITNDPNANLSGSVDGKWKIMFFSVFLLIFCMATYLYLDFSFCCVVLLICCFF